MRHVWYRPSARVIGVLVLAVTMVVGWSADAGSIAGKGVRVGSVVSKVDDYRSPVIESNSTTGVTGGPMFGSFVTYGFGGRLAAQVELLVARKGAAINGCDGAGCPGDGGLSLGYSFAN